MPQTDPKSSSSGIGQQQTAQTIPYSPPYPQQFEDDTIELYELWITIWKWKWLVIALTVVAAIGSVVYALATPRVYKAEALLLSPKGKDVQAMTVMGLKKLSEGGKTHIMVTGPSAEDIFSKYKQNLNSRTLHKKFIKEYGLMNLLAPDRTPETRDEDIYQAFSKKIKLGEENEITSLSIELHDSVMAAQWVNDLTEFVDKETVAMIVDDLRNSIANQIKSVEYTIISKKQMVIKRREDQISEIEIKIKSKRVMSEIRRKDQIVRYQEAAKTAQVLGIMTGLTQQTKIVENSRGIIQPINPTETTGNSPITQMNVDIATATTPLFFMGYDALLSELDILMSRSNDDPFIPGLRDLQEQLALLNSIESEDSFIDGLRDLQEQLALLRTIKFDQEKMSAVSIDQPAYPPNSPINPNRRFIVSIATVVGLFLGIFLAFFIEFVVNQRKKHLG